MDSHPSTSSSTASTGTRSLSLREASPGKVPGAVPEDDIDAGRRRATDGCSRQPVQARGRSVSFSFDTTSCSRALARRRTSNAEIDNEVRVVSVEQEPGEDGCAGRGSIWLSQFAEDEKTGLPIQGDL